MKTTILTVYSKKIQLKELLLLCGILSSLLYVGMNIIAASRYEGYSSISQTVSELSAIGAPTRSLWNPLVIIYELLLIAFGFGVRLSSLQKRSVRILGSMLVVFGMIGLAWPLGSMHTREVLADGGGNMSDILHIILGSVTIPFMLTAIGFGSVAFGIRFRIYSIVSILLILAFGILVGLNSPRIHANLPTPWVGIWERISIAGFLLWVVVLAIILLRLRKGEDLVNATIPNHEQPG